MPWPALFIVAEFSSPELDGLQVWEPKCVSDKTGTLIQGQSFHVCVWILRADDHQHLPVLGFPYEFVISNPRPDK